MRSGTLQTVWNLLSKEERRTAGVLSLALTVGVILEIISFGALLPAITVLTEGLSRTGIPLLSSVISDKDEIFVVSFVVIGLTTIFAVKSIYAVWIIWFQREFCRQIEQRLASGALRYYLNKPYVFHVDHNSAELMRNVGTAGEFVSLSVNSLLILGTDGAVLIALLGLLMVVEPIATAVLIFFLGVLGATFYLLTRRRIATWGTIRTNLESKKIQVLQEGFAAIKELKAMECEEEFAAKYELHLSQSTRISRNYETLATLPRVWLEFLAFTGLGVLLIALTAGGRSLAQSLPELAVFSAAAFRVLPTLNRIIFAVQNLRYGKAATEILVDATTPLTREPLVKREVPSTGFVEFRNISFQYPKATVPVLENVSFQVRSGEMVGICGESGSGKSTLACLTLGLLQPTHGQVVIGGVTINKPVGKLIGYVPQSVYLIDDTIKKNVAFGTPNKLIDDDRILWALSQAHLSNFVSEKSEGINFLVGENGSKLSGGQRQRIGIARALYSDPKILVLDEATSALDALTSKQILTELLSMRGLRTLFIISHDSEMLRNCDSTMQVSQGTVTLI